MKSAWRLSGRGLPHHRFKRWAWVRARVCLWRNPRSRQNFQHAQNLKKKKVANLSRHLAGKEKHMWEMSDVVINLQHFFFRSTARVEVLSWPWDAPRDRNGRSPVSGCAWRARQHPAGQPSRKLHYCFEVVEPLWSKLICLFFFARHTLNPLLFLPSPATTI